MAVLHVQNGKIFFSLNLKNVQDTIYILKRNKRIRYTKASKYIKRSQIIFQFSSRFSPIGVSSIIASKLVAMQNIGGTVQNLGLFIAALITGSIVYGFIILPAIYVLLLRKNPFSLMSCVSKALITGIGTASR